MHRVDAWRMVQRRERARAADGRAEQGALVVAGDAGGTNVLTARPNSA
jgi:hypothetical protein